MTLQRGKILKALLEGLSGKEIAAQQCISLSTVRFHIRNIFTEYGVASRTELLGKFGHFEISVRWVSNTKKEEV